MHCEDLFDTPIWHGIADKHCASCNFIFPLLLSPHRHTQLSDRDPLRRFDAALNQISSRSRLHFFCSVIGLLCPLVFNELDAAPVDYREVPVTRTDNDKRCPPRVSFHSESNLHDSNLMIQSTCFDGGLAHAYQHSSFGASNPASYQRTTL